VLSLVLCMATVAAWVRSYQAHDVALWSPASGRLLSISTFRGGLFAGVMEPFFIDNWPTHRAEAASSSPVDYAELGGPQDSTLHRLGFSLLQKFYPSEQRYFACPYWFIMLLTAILPAARFVGWRRRARRLRMHPGLCRHCGYDCRATPDRCPECGRVAASPS
jgi:hypothetical protein